jgi:glucose/arabinose dehydrogenase
MRTTWLGGGAAFAVVTLTLAAAACAPTDDVPDRAASSARGSGTDGRTAPSTSSAEARAPSPSHVLPTGNPVDVVTGLRSPWSIVFLGTTALVSERDSARVLELTPGGTRVVGTVPGVARGGEGGLLGLAATDEPGAPHLLAYSTGPDGNRVQEFAFTGGPGSYAFGAVRTVIDGLPSARNHNGGRIAFGPDGMLYVAVGDAGRPDRAQDLADLAGKILRLEPDGGVPVDNPFPGSPVYSLGHRNVQGLGWTADGRLVASEFGQDTWDELNVIEPGGNYGWPVVEGVGGASQGFIDPVQQWPTDGASPSGLAVVEGTVFVANLRGGRLRAVPVSGLGTAEEFYGGTYGRLRDVALAPDGRLWILTDNTDGRGDPRPGDDRVLAVQVAAAPSD